MGYLDGSRSTVCTSDDRPAESNKSNGQHDLALNTAVAGPLMRARSLGQRECAVDDDSHNAVVEQAGGFCQLHAIGSNLCGRDRDAQLLCLLVTSEAQRV